ncbi:MAG: hypothetical protein ACFBZ8_04145 [Opitutales bacterium]
MPPPRQSRRTRRRPVRPRTGAPVKWDLLQRGAFPARLQRRALVIAVLCTLVVNAGAGWGAYETFTNAIQESGDDLSLRLRPSSSLQLGLKLAQTPPPNKTEEEEEEELVPVPEPPRPEYVEANPDANQDFPDEETNQESFQNQVAAQPDPDFLAEDDFPSVEDGEIETSQSIVVGTLEDPSQYVPQGQPVEPQPDSQPTEAAQETAQPAPAPPPTPELIQVEELDPDGTGATEKEPTENEELPDDSLPEMVELFLPEVPPVEDPSDQPVEQPQQQQPQEQRPPSEQTPQQGLPDPKPRPRLSAPELPTSLTRKTDSVAARLGQIAVSSRLSRYGIYYQQFYEAIYRRWLIKLENYPFTPSDLGTKVTVTGELDRDGRVHNLRITDATGTRQFALICEDAIFENSPYGPWSDDMIRVLSEREFFSITFHLR